MTSSTAISFLSFPAVRACLFEKGERIAQRREGLCPSTAKVERKFFQFLRERCSNGVVEIESRRLTLEKRVVGRDGPLAGLEAPCDRELITSEKVEILSHFSGSTNGLALSRNLIDRV